MSRHRPWGKLDWVLPLAGNLNWTVLGCLGAEERSISALVELHQRGWLLKNKLVCVVDPKPEAPAAIEEQLRHRRNTLLHHSIACSEKSFGLFDPRSSWEDVFDSSTSESVVLDISTMPKRFFFVLLRRILKDPTVKNLVVTYTTALRYPGDSWGGLSGNEEPWQNLPGFGDEQGSREEETPRLIASVGFMPDVLSQARLGKVDGKRSIDLILPFPAPTSATSRNWDAVAQLSKLDDLNPQIHRCGTDDLPEAFDLLNRLTENGTKAAVLAPFGPKPISAAMCLFASLTGTPVFYAQPKHYSPFYSVGSGEILGYWIKHDGQPMFELE